MLNCPESRQDQAWQIFLVLLARRQPEENPFHLAQDAFRAADAFEKARLGQGEDPPPPPPPERRGF